MATQRPAACAALVLVLVLGAPLLTGGQQPPPNYSYDALPDTSFTCEGRVVGGYYADVEAGCQMFHVCGTSQRTSFRFLCPNNTVFDQQHLICASWFQVSCDRATVLYARNFEIFKTGAEEEVEFNALDEDSLPPLDDYDYQPELGGIGRLIGGGGGGRSVGGQQVLPSRAPVTRRPVTQAPVTQAPVTRVPAASFTANKAPRRFDQTTAATTPRPSLSSAAGASFRDQSTFAASPGTTAPSRQTPSAPPAAARGASSSSQRPFSFAGTPGAPARVVTSRTTASRPAPTSPRPAAFTPSAAATPSAGVSFSTPRPVFTTTGTFPFGFTSVPQSSFAFGSGGSFSFGTAVDSRASSVVSLPRVPPPTQAGSTQGSEVAFQPSSPPAAQTTAPVTARPPSAQPVTPTPQRAVAVSSVAPFVRGTTPRPDEPARTVSPVAGRFFGANVLPQPAASGGGPRPRGRGRNTFRLNSVDADRLQDVTVSEDDVVYVDDDINYIDDTGSAAVATTVTPGGRFSATVPTRSPSTRLSGDGSAVTTFRPRPSGGGARRFDPRLPGGDLKPVQYVRAGRGRANRPSQPARAPSPQDVIAEVAALSEDLNLLEDAEENAEDKEEEESTTSTLPTNKEASRLGRQNGFFLRPKLQLSSALPIAAQTRRLNDVNSLASERTGRSRNTSPIAFNRVVRSTTRAPLLDARLSDILFASSSPGSARKDPDSDYDYEYYDSDFRLEHQQAIDETDNLFQTLSRKTRRT
ncbi:flocculation protein FLO11-like [Pollicipes pollicipes]|uniref:flocculation protein FLO11-like n=1 Tax=Pollicipes pollicipes TaxID=41117 RepID=UPI001884C36E|nr:flocculation protein FLO11-like [Pollicipes pollicipes]